MEPGDPKKKPSPSKKSQPTKRATKAAAKKTAAQTDAPSTNRPAKTPGRKTTKKTTKKTTAAAKATGRSRSATPPPPPPRTKKTTPSNPYLQGGILKTTPEQPPQLPEPLPILPPGSIITRLVFSVADRGWAVAVALLCGWTGLIIALWAAFLGLFLGAFLALGTIAANSVTRQLFNAGTGQAVGAIGVVTGAIAGAGGAFVAVYTHLIFGNISHVLISLIAGALLAIVITMLVTSFEGDYLRVVRGFRHLSVAEARRIAPLLKTAGDLMNLRAFPKLAMADRDLPSAWTHSKHIVLTTALLETLNDAELIAVLAHELSHWNRGDSLGVTYVTACAWPVTITYNVASYLSGYRLEAEGKLRHVTNAVSLVVWFLFWPTMFLTRFVIGPVTAAQCRSAEYTADAAVAAIGYGPSLASALSRMPKFEGGRTGWEAVLFASHPPLALRLDQLRPSMPGDADYVDAPLGTVTPERVRKVGYAALLIVGCVIAGGAVLNNYRADHRALHSFPQTTTGATQAAIAYEKQIFENGGNASKVQSLIQDNSVSGATATLLADIQPFLSAFTTAQNDGYNPYFVVIVNGCSTSLNSATTVGTVNLSQDLQLHSGGFSTRHLPVEVVMGLQWSASGWRVSSFAHAPIGTSGWPSNFGACP